MKSYRQQAIIVTLILTIMCVVACFSIEDSLKNIVNYFTIIGTSISLLGLYYAYIQILSIKENNIQTMLAVQSSINRINQILSVSDLSKSIKSIDEIQNYLKKEEVTLALLRMKDIKSVIISVKYIHHLKEYTSKKEYSGILQDFQIDHQNLNSFIHDGSKKPDFMKIHLNLEKLATKLSEFENHLKTLKYE